MSNLVTCRNQIIPIAARSIAAAAALCCAGLASAQSSVTVYGIVDAAVTVTNNQTGGTKTQLEAGQLATSRWGFKGTEDLGGGLKANFMLESTLANDTGAGGSSFGGGFVQAGTTASFFDREATVGLSGGFGSVNAGRQNMLGVNSIGLADPIGLAHAGTNPNVVYSALNSGTRFGGYGTNGGGTELRQNNSIKYVTPVMSGFIGAAMYGFGEKAGDNSASSYAALSGVFTDGKSGIALAYAKLKDATNASNMDLVGGGAKYVMNNAFTFKATYAQSEVDGTSIVPAFRNRKIAVTGLGIDYALSAAATLTGAYYNTKQSGSILGSGKADQYIAMGKYALSKRTIAYASLTYVDAGSATNPADLQMAAGLVGNGNSDATRVAFGVMHSF
jgi:predicted porin